MHYKNLVARLALACTFALSAAAFAGDTTQIEVTANGVTEKISLEDLAIGETRQLYSDTGTLVTATRTADALVLDIDGDKTTVPLPETGELSDEAIEALLAAHGTEGANGHGKAHVIRVHRTDGEAGEHADGAHRVIVLDGKDGAPADGKRVIVKRTVKKDAAQP